MTASKQCQLIYTFRDIFQERIGVWGALAATRQQGGATGWVTASAGVYWFARKPTAGPSMTWSIPVYHARCDNESGNERSSHILAGVGSAASWYDAGYLFSFGNNTDIVFRSIEIEIKLLGTSDCIFNIYISDGTYRSRSGNKIICKMRRRETELLS